MSLTAPPRRSVTDRMPLGIDDAVIEEARRRAGRRRRIYTGALVMALTGAALFVALARTPSSPDPPPGGSVAAAPDAGVPSAEPTLVAHFGAVHGGWVLVYSDGRMLVNPDKGEATLDVPGGSFAERRLSVRGLALVRSGAVPLSAFLTDKGLMESATLWAEPDLRPYSAASGEPGAGGFVSCIVKEGGGRVRPELATQLPSGVQSLVQGTQRTFRFLPYQALMRAGGGLTQETSGAPVPQECFAIDAVRARALTRMHPLPASDPYEFLDAEKTVRGYLTFTGKDESQISLEISLALPDRVIVATGG